MPSLALRSTILAGLALTVGCAPAGSPAGSPEVERAGPPTLAVAAVSSPAPDGSRFPSLVCTPAGGALMSWLEPTDDGPTRLACSSLEGAAWGAVRTIARGDGFFVNWADFPALAATPEGWLATWLQKLGDGTYAYGVRTATSGDRGETWNETGHLHTDRSEVEHGFVSLATLDAGRVHAAWLDGRNTGGGHGGSGAMALFAATVDAAGSVSGEHALDERVCDCCQTASCLLPGGSVLVAYRDRSADEVRDISFVRGDPADAGSWSAPKTLWSDGWKITGCPVNGPAVAASGPNVAVAWFTLGRDSRPRVQLARSSDGAATFGPPLQIDEGAPIGRVDAVFVGDSLLVSWLETAGDAAQWRVRAFVPGGAPGASAVVAEIASERSSGFLRLAPHAGGALAAWTAAGPRVALARIELGETPR